MCTELPAGRGCALGCALSLSPEQLGVRGTVVPGPGGGGSGRALAGAGAGLGAGGAEVGSELEDRAVGQKKQRVVVMPGRSCPLPQAPGSRAR